MERPAHLEHEMTRSAVLFRNVRIFDGTSDQLTEPINVLVVGKTIATIDKQPITTPQGATVIEGGSRVLMPGLTDAHWHILAAGNDIAELNFGNIGLVYANAIAEAHRTLLRGFTTVRDMAGDVFGIKLAIDRGTIPGPRVYPSGAAISQTGGHGDFTFVYQRPTTFGGSPSHMEDIGFMTIADGPDAVLTAVREQLKKGASQIKLMAGGGVASLYDPIDVTQYTGEELKAAVQAAENWGTYVAVHVYTPQAIQQAIAAGVKSIDHGHLADEATVKLMAEKGVWLSTQPFAESDHSFPTADQQAKNRAVCNGTDNVYRWAKQYRVKVAFGTDLLFEPQDNYKQNEMLTRVAQYYSNVEVLKMATSQNAQLFAMSGKRNPYQEAKLGVVKEGAFADLLLVEGDPTADINVLKDHEKNFVVVMKDGTIFKDILR